jgi:hypothetical protein
VAELSLYSRLLGRRRSTNVVDRGRGRRVNVDPAYLEPQDFVRRVVKAPPSDYPRDAKRIRRARNGNAMGSLRGRAALLRAMG